MANHIFVRLTANSERNLEGIETFLAEAEVPQAYDALLDQLLDQAIPNLENFPRIGFPFLDHPTRSVEAKLNLEAMQRLLGEGELREYLLADYLILYARYEEVIYLLSIRHHRQLSFDFDHLWASSPMKSRQ